MDLTAHIAVMLSIDSPYVLCKDNLAQTCWMKHRIVFEIKICVKTIIVIWVRGRARDVTL